MTAQTLWPPPSGTATDAFREERLKKLQFCHQDPSGKCRGGIVVSDRRTAQSSHLTFGSAKSDAAASMPLAGIPEQQTSGSTLPLTP
ncbi:hypothetical protein [Streptomyces sp. NBC_01240]|uniref:hypothetical protein n=1 Tax=Streptomyces sp. NBC_01240 TaxID=2903793 RepID=UPI002E160FA3|nr:hypothetical protein OG466_11370 [Streptomyces sp. NBC_01240]